MRFSEAMAGLGDIIAPAGDPVVVRVSEDSRKVRTGDLFIARSGTKTSGAQYAADAISRGAVAIVAEDDIAVPAQVAFARVVDAKQALPLLAHRVAGYPTAGMRMLAVTGTKGKTTIAYLLRSIFRQAGVRCGMVGTVEIDDGVAAVPAEMTTPGAAELVDLFCRMRHHRVTHCVMETSSHALHQQRVAGIDFSVGIFTNLTGDHLDYHQTMDEYAAAKALLFSGLSSEATAVLNIDDPWAEKMVAPCRANVVRCSVAGAAAASWNVTIVQMSASGMRLQLRGPGGESLAFATPLVGRHNACNLVLAVAAARALGVPRDVISAALENNVGAPGRLQPVRPTAGGGKFQVFVDYAHTHDALQNVLTALRQTMGGGRLICVFGCGGDRDRTKRPKMAAVAEKFADRVIVTSDNPRTEDPQAIIREIRAGFSPAANGNVTIEPDRRAAIRLAIAGAAPGDVVLIAGKGHENYQIIGTTKHHFDDVEEAAAALGSESSL